MSEPSLVLFVCLHASAKSLIAAEYFNRLAVERKLPFRAFSAGTEPDDAVPPHVVAGLGGDGFDVSRRKPQRLTKDVAMPAEIAITFEPDLQGGALVGAGRERRLRDRAGRDQGAGRAAGGGARRVIPQKRESHSHETSNDRWRDRGARTRRGHVGLG